MKIKLEDGAIMPTRAYSTDAGLDLYSPVEFVIDGKCRGIINTGVCIELPEGTYGRVASKSGLMTKNGIITDGTVDEGYTGAIRVCLFNMSELPIKFSKGDKIAQLIICKCEKPELELVDELGKTPRGDKGFGSTGK